MKNHTKLLIEKNTPNSTWNTLHGIFVLKKLHHIQKKIRAKLKFLHQITKFLYEIYFFFHQIRKILQETLKFLHQIRSALHQTDDTFGLPYFLLVYVQKYSFKWTLSTQENPRKSHQSIEIELVI